MDKEVILTPQESDIIITLLLAEIKHLAKIRLEFHEKDIDCGGINNRIDRLNALVRRISHE